MSDVVKRYEDAVNSFIKKIEDDPNVIALIIMGSMAHSRVWEKSDVDMILIVRDQKLVRTTYGVNEDDILLNVQLVQRSDMKRSFEKSLTGSIGHHFGATSRIAFTKDDSLLEYFDDYKNIGKADVEKALFRMSNWLLGTMEKIEKWLVVNDDPEYARLYCLKAAEVIASMEVCANYESPTREAILRAQSLNPALMDKYYTGPMSGKMDKKEIYALLEGMNEYVCGHMEAILNVAEDFFGDGEIKTGTHISTHFNSNMHEFHPIMDFLCERGALDKISQTMKITPKSKMAVEEIAFIMPK